MTTNIERAYLTTVSADDLAQAVAENFRAHDFQVQTFRSPDNATVMQARKDSLWRQAVGTAYAVTVVITPGEGQLSLRLGPHEWVDTAVSAGIGVLLLPPVLIGTIWGVWKEHSLDDRVWRIVDERIKAAEPDTSLATTEAQPASNEAQPANTGAQSGEVQ
jgi:hypothetical protein